MKKIDSPSEPSPRQWSETLRLLQQSDFVHAEALCREATLAHPDDPRWQLALALTLLNQGKAEEALPHAYQVAQEDPDNPEAYRIIVLAHAELGDQPRAMEAAMFVLRLAPSHASRELVKSVRNFRKPPCSDEEQALSSALLAEARSEPSLSRIYRLPAAGSDAANLQEQLSLFFGAELFGELTPERGTSQRTQAQKKPTRLGWRVLAAVSLVAVLAIPVQTIIDRGMTRQHTAEADRMAQEIREFLQVGDLAHVTENLPALERILPETEGLGAAHLPLLMRAQATLYRYQDADPRRRDKVRAWLETAGAKPSYDQVVSGALLAARADRLELVEQLRRVDGPQNRDSEASFLIASALEAADVYEPATAAYARASDLGPYQLHHLAGMVSFAARRGDPGAAQKTLDIMRDENARADWTLSALQERALPSGRQTPGVAAQPAAPVPAGEVLLLHSLVELEKKNWTTARALLVQATDRIHHQPVFALDYCALLLQKDHVEAARFLFATENLAGSSPAATALEARLLMAQGEIGRGLALLQGLWSQGDRTPRVGSVLARELLLENPRDPRANEILAELTARWPSLLPLEIEYARLLLDQGEGKAVGERLFARLPEFQKNAPPPIRSTAYQLLAMSQAGQGDLKAAAGLYKQALAANPDNAQAKRSLSQMEREEDAARRAKKKLEREAKSKRKRKNRTR